MEDLVTIGIPIYKRLNYLPHVLSLVRAQNYPFIELLVSDNGMNGEKVKDIVSTHYDKHCKIRQNPLTVPISTHFNQIINEAAGEYFVMLADDDEISYNYVSELVRLLKQNPSSSVGIAKQEVLNEAGVIIRQSRDTLPDVLSGPDFITAAWHTYEYGFECFATFLARTKDLKQCGGYPDFAQGNHIDNALLIKLCLNKYVVFGKSCTFRWRLYESSLGWSVSMDDLAQASRQFLKFLNTDPAIEKFASTNPSQWREMKRHLVKMAWWTYLDRWHGIYKKRLPSLQWIGAAFGMPFIPAYYREVAFVLLEALMTARFRTKSLP